jgi:hypothetical protein
MFNIRYYYFAEKHESPVEDFINGLEKKEMAKVFRNIVLLQEL